MLDWKCDSLPMGDISLMHKSNALWKPFTEYLGWVKHLIVLDITG
jgi:hypothetical protein